MSRGLGTGDRSKDKFGMKFYSFVESSNKGKGKRFWKPVIADELGSVY